MGTRLLSVHSRVGNAKVRLTATIHGGVCPLAFSSGWGRSSREWYFDGPTREDLPRDSSEDMEGRVPRGLGSEALASGGGGGSLGPRRGIGFGKGSR